jgi:hypothetical protein
MPRPPNTHISFDADDLKDCERAVGELQNIILNMYGASVARQLFEGATLPRRKVKADKNAFLLAGYLHHSRRYGWGVKRCAKYFAATNKRLPREWGFGPSGSTVPATMEKQLSRGIKRMNKDRSYRDFIEDYAAGRGFLPILAHTMCQDPLFGKFLIEVASPPVRTFQS